MSHLPRILACLLVAILLVAVVEKPLLAAEPATEGKAAEAPLADPLESPSLKRLAPDDEAWIDPANKRVVLGGTICLRQGPLEMFACVAGTKEHESIVAIKSKAYAIHAALLALGAEAGAPVEFRPKYRPARGTEIDVWVYWHDEKNQLRRVRAQDWIRNMRTGKNLDANWVFGGSGFWQDEMTGQKYYLADDGDLICVSNFPSAMLDLPIESSQANDALLFEANTDLIPPLEAKVTVVLEPKMKKLSSKLKPVAPGKAK
ncbi:MAG: hypothetical protein KF708_00695 [Pirellulales bacterium]|nr:hypothetical protein [Pirellulales bacterium]